MLKRLPPPLFDIITVNPESKLSDFQLYALGLEQTSLIENDFAVFYFVWGGRQLHCHPPLFDIITVNLESKLSDFQDYVKRFVLFEVTFL